jgi:hypothetical protein
VKSLGIGVREVVAIAALCGAILLGFAFCDPTSSESHSTNRPTPTIPAREPAEGLSPWTVTYVQGKDLDHGVIVGSGTFPQLDLTYQGGPFPDVPDNAWGLFAVSTFTGVPGKYHIQVSWRGDLRLTVNGIDEKVKPSFGEKTILFPFEQTADTPTTISIRLIDVTGAAHLVAAVVER